MHEVKGFPSAGLNSIYKKTINGQSEFVRDSKLPNVLGSINGYEAPPTEVNGDIYAVSSPELDVNRLSWQGGTTVRVTFSAGYDSTLYTVNSYLTLSGEVNKPIHNGVWVITSVAAGWVDITNSGVTDNTNDVGALSPSVGYVTHEDFDPFDLAGGRVIPRVGQVRYYSTVDLWHGDSFEAGDCYYNIALGNNVCYNGVDSVSLSMNNLPITTAQMFAMLSPEIGVVFFNTDLETLVTWTGNSWIEFESKDIFKTAFIEDFESGSFATNGWVTVNGGENDWFVGTNSANPLDGVNSAYISTDGGTTASYSSIGGGLDVSHVYIDIAIPVGATNITFQFDWVCEAEVGFDWGSVYNKTTAFTPLADTEIVGDQ